MFEMIHNFALSIGYAIIDFFVNFPVDTVLSALSITVTGWLGIFIVTGVIIGVVNLLGWISSKLPEE